MPDPLANLLTDPLLQVQLAAGLRLLSLPGVLAALAQDQVAQFPGLQAHQEHAWHAFLVQVAAMALHRAGEGAPPTEPERWSPLLLALTDHQTSAWRLTEPDLSQPAFLQPPVPEGSVSAWKNILPTPDALDLLVTAKNMDVKGRRVHHPLPEHWVYALVSLQTMEGFSGRGNYGILRMNSGFGNRPFVACSASLRPGRRFLEDLGALLKTRSQLADLGLFAPEGGLCFASLRPWDGKTSLRLDELDPYFVEVCRRVRLGATPTGMQARMAPSECARVRAPELTPGVGDPWTPVRREDGKPLTVSSRGFHYTVVHNLLWTGDYAQPPSLEIDEQRTRFLGAALVRGQGKTEGFYERVVPIPPKVARRIRGPVDARVRVGELSKGQIEDVDKLRSKALRPALRTLLDGGTSRGLRQDSRPDRWMDALDRAVDAEFFHHLWRRVEAESEEEREAAELAWLRRIYALGEEQLQDAIQSAPIPLARRYQAITAAERIFHGSIRKQFQKLTASESNHGEP